MVCIALLLTAGGVNAAPEDSAVFDGFGSLVRVDDPHEGPIQALTISCWVNLDDDQATQAIASRGDWGGLSVSSPYSYGLAVRSGKLRFRVRQQTGPRRMVETASPTTGEWTHIAGVLGDGEIRLYVNGFLAGEQRASRAIPASKEPLYVGASGPFANVLNGRMADFQVWEKALSAEEVAALCKSRSAPTAPPTISLVGADLADAVQTATPSEEHGYQLLSNGELPVADGFRGIWYANQPSKDEYVYKYSGGKATYPHQHTPIAIYSPEADKTFFVYGGRYRDRNVLLHTISYYDHKTGMVARPRVLLDKRTDDAHDNPTLSIDDKGYLYVFSSAHGTSRPSYIHKSSKPYDISSFECLKKTNFSYTQPWFVPEHGLVFMHTRYQKGRVLFVMNSRDGANWSEPKKLAHIQAGHYQVTRTWKNRVGTAFNFHPTDAPGAPLNWRTNLYYMQTDDGGETWQNAQGETVQTPITKPDNPALVQEYKSKDRNCYMKCLRYTPDGRPVILHLTSGGYESGPKNDPRKFRVAVWTGSEWRVTDAMGQGDNNYDYAFLDILPDGQWQITGTTQPGPQSYNTGGEMAIWKSKDEGVTWQLTKHLTEGSPYNHCYPRQPVNAKPEFYALWADGHGRKPSKSRLYFTDREGTAVWRLPPTIEGDAMMVKPIRFDSKLD